MPAGPTPFVRRAQEALWIAVLLCTGGAFGAAGAAWRLGPSWWLVAELLAACGYVGARVYLGR